MLSRKIECKEIKKLNEWLSANAKMEHMFWSASQVQWYYVCLQSQYQILGSFLLINQNLGASFVQLELITVVSLK